MKRILAFIITIIFSISPLSIRGDESINENEAEDIAVEFFEDETDCEGDLGEITADANDDVESWEVEVESEVESSECESDATITVDKNSGDAELN